MINQKTMFLFFCLIFFAQIESKSIKSSKKYQPKKMYSGLGKKSKVNGLIKAKGTSGHWKGNPLKGYKFVNSYSRSK